MQDLKFVKLVPEFDLEEYIDQKYLKEDAIHRELSIDWENVPIDARDPDFYLTLTVDEIDLDAFAPLALAIGPPDLCIDFRLRRHLINDRVILPLSYKIMSHLWGVTHAGTLLWKDCFFSNSDQETLNAVIDRDHVRAAFNVIASTLHPGPVATGLFPPIFMQEFWGPRSYGALDAHLANLATMNIVSSHLLEKAENLNAPNNWALVLSEKHAEDKEIFKALRPLIEHRQGEIIVLKDGHPGAAIDSFGMDVCNRPIEERPYYLLVVGDLDAISMESYYFLQSFGGTGRLPFNTAEELERYVAKVIEAENSFPAEQANLMFIGTDRDDTNTENFEGIINPLYDRLADKEFPVSLIGWGKATKAEVKGILSAAPDHSLAFISAHGFEILAEAAKDSAKMLEMQRAYQGALILDDFMEENDCQVHPGSPQPGLLTAADVRDIAFLKSGIFFMHACYSGGTVTRDTMPEWIHLPLRNRRIPEAPFTSALSKELLLNPEGPIALFGHINRSYLYNYYYPNVQGDSVTQDAYYVMLDRLCQGHTIGYGREIFRARAYEYMSQLMTISHQIEMKLHGSCRHGMQGTVSKPIEAYEQAFLQYSFATCNYRNYVILGDPMCRLLQRNSSH